MPVYEFACPKCSHRFELVRPMSQASAAARCPKCKSKANRLFTAMILTGGTGSSDFDLDEDMMAGMGGGHDHGHSHGMDDFGDFDDDF